MISLATKRRCRIHNMLHRSNKLVVKHPSFLMQLNEAHTPTSGKRGIHHRRDVASCLLLSMGYVLIRFRLRYPMHWLLTVPVMGLGLSYDSTQFHLDTHQKWKRQ